MLAKLVCLTGRNPSDRPTRKSCSHGRRPYRSAQVACSTPTGLAMKLLAFLLLIVGANSRVQAAIDAVYDGSNGIRSKVLTVCLSCHSSTLTGGARNSAPPTVDFNTYASALLWGDLAVIRAVGGTMPPAGNPALNQEQKAALQAWQAAGFPEKAAPVVPPADSQAPTIPAGLNATVPSSSEINLAWAASTDNVAVTSYKVYRGGSLIATLGNVTSYRDKGLAAATSYTYNVTACDAASNCSLLSAPLAASTQPNVGTNQLPDCLFSWAETSYPSVFAPRAVSSSLGIYYFRAYAQSTYLAVASGRLYYLGPLSANSAVDLGDVIAWYVTSGCEQP